LLVNHKKSPSAGVSALGAQNVEGASIYIAVSWNRAFK